LRAFLGSLAVSILIVAGTSAAGAETDAAEAKQRMLDACIANPQPSAKPGQIEPFCNCFVDFAAETMQPEALIAHALILESFGSDQRPDEAAIAAEAGISLTDLEEQSGKLMEAMGSNCPPLG
jgi:hypothetical protein